jgi:hypothetical protein
MPAYHVGNDGFGNEKAYWRLGPVAIISNNNAVLRDGILLMNNDLVIQHYSSYDKLLTAVG